MSNSDEDSKSDDYFEFMLTEALDDYIKTQYNAYKTDLDKIQKPELSDEYKKEINKLIQCNPISSGWFQWKKIAVATIILVVSGSTFLYSVDADLRSFFNSIFTNRETHIDVSYNTTNLKYDFSVISKDWEYFYVPQYLPTGYQVDEIISNKTNLTISYSMGKESICYIMGKNTSSSYSIDTEHSNFEKVKFLNSEGYYLEGEQMNTLIWYYDDKSFQLDGQIEKKELIKIAESIKIIDR